MAKFYRLKIENIYLTDDGLETGLPCKLNTTNLEDILSTMTGAVIPSADGTAVLQIVPFTKGKAFEIQIDVLTKSVWEQLRDLMTGSLETDSDFEVSGTGDIGNFTARAKPNPQKPFFAARFKNGRIYNCVIRFMTV